MSDNKQNEVLTGYEQLKRRNRRRLVMASGLVAASTVLLGVALSTGPENKPEENAQTTTIQQNNANAEPTNLADATVLEPSTKEDLEVAAEAAKNADAEVADKPQETAAPEQTAQAEPQPDAPQSTTHAPWGTCRSMSTTPWLPPSYRNVTRSRRITALLRSRARTGRFPSSRQQARSHPVLRTAARNSCFECRFFPLRARWPTR